MTPEIIIRTIILCAITGLILYGIWKEEKLAAFEKRVRIKIKKKLNLF